MDERRRVRYLVWLYAAGDVWAVVAAYYATLLVRFHCAAGERFFEWAKLQLTVPPAFPGTPLDYENFYWLGAPRIIALLALTVCSLYALFNLYAGTRFIRPRQAAVSVMAANAWALLLFFAYLYLSRNQFHPRSFFILTVTFNTAACLAIRSALTGLLRAARRRGTDDCPVLLVGSGREAGFIADYIQALRPHGLRVAARLSLSAPLEAGGEARLREAVAASGARMIVCADRGLTLSTIMRILELADEWGLTAKIWSSELEVLVTQARMPADLFFGVPLVHFPPVRQGALYDGVKRAVSVAISLLALLLLGPFMLLIALVIRLTSPGAALFVQERIGINRQPFRMYKFRTMHTDAEERQAQVEEFNESGSAGLFKMRRDPRVTPFGRFLRRFSLDELPQLVNVLRGDMTLVGPRPLPRRDFGNYYETWHYGRHGGLPGMTGLWQVSGRSDVGFQSMCILDIYYLRNSGLLLDLKIALRTVIGVLFARGAY